MSSRDQKIADKNSGLLSTSFRPDRSQIINITDILSEGPIEGLVSGESSIKLNRDPIRDPVVEGPSTRTNYTLIKTAGETVTEAIVTPALYPEALPGVTVALVVVQVNNAYNEIITASAVTFPGGMAQASASAKPFVDITTSISSIFPSWSNQSRPTTEYNRRIARAGAPKTYLEGKFERLSDTTARFYFKDSNTSLIQAFFDQASDDGDSLRVQIDYENTCVAREGEEDVTLVSPWQLGDGTFSDLTLIRLVTRVGGSTGGLGAGSKYKSVSAQFRPGTLEQEPMINYSNTTGVAFPQGPSFQNQALEFWDDLSQEYKDLVAAGGDTSGLNVGQVNPVKFRGTSPTGFGLTYEQAPEVDEIRFTFSYSSLFALKEKDGDYRNAGVFYNIKLKLYRGASISEVVLRSGDNQLLHQAGKDGSRGALLIEEKIWLEPFKPFDDFELTIERTTRQEGRAVYPSGENGGKGKIINAPAAITNLSSIIKEPLNYPYTAYANIRFDSTEFSSAPLRTYELRGMRVKIPSNYITREENGTDIATYEGLWDGSFKSELTYTDNPAWVFYDIVTNNRYGLGAWISSSDIDKYSLYRIAKYCDDLVPDGKGGLEPRYRANIYLTKAVDAYKLLKDIASIFVGLVYWLDGKVTPVADQASWPVYTFTASNVLDGRFNYTGTGAKTRPNQIVVGYNNPDKNYIIDPVIVEDRVRIAQENRIQSNYVNAFGATTEGQAQRYGRYKLWTSNYQTEIVSFKTSLNAAFIRPGDIVQVQDQARERLISSGRVESATSTTITLDRAVPLQDDISYSLYGLITTSAAFCAQETAVIEGTTYTSGEVLPLDLYIDETTASNILDDDEVPITIRWAPYTFMEERPIDYATTTGGDAGSYNVVTITDPFTSTLIPASIWSIAQINTEYELPILGAPKLYKILSVGQEETNVYSITAVEHFNEKFANVESDYDIYQPDRFDPPIERAALRVPAPTAIFIAQDSDYKTRTDEIVVKWLPPIVDGEEYQYLAGYKISHNIPGQPNPIFTDKGLDERVFTGLTEGTYQIGVQAISTLGTSSPMTTVTHLLNDPFSAQIPRLAEGIGQGGVCLKSPIVTAGVTPEFKFDSSSNVTIFPAAAPEMPLILQSTDKLNLYSLGVEEEKTYYVLAKSSGALQPDDDTTIARNCTLKLIDFSQDNFWYDVISTTGIPDNNFSALPTNPNNIAIKKGEVYVTGTLTSFSSEVQVRDYIKIIDENSEVLHTAKVLAVISDELLIIDNPPNIAINSVLNTIKKSNLNFLFEEDTIIASVRKSSVDGSWTVVNYLTNDPNVDKVRLLDVAKVGGDTIDYDISGTALSSQFSIDIDTTGYTNPIVTVTGDAFNYLNESEETVGTSGVSQTRTFNLTDSSYNASTLEFNVSIVEGGDPDNIEAAIERNYYVKKQYDASSFVKFGDITVVVAAPSGTGNLVYDTAGTFTYTPPVSGLPAILSDGNAPSLNTNITDVEVRSLIGAGTSSLILGTTAGTALEGDTALLQLGTTAGTALAGDTALLQLGTTAGTALEGDTALLQLGTTAGTALAGDTALLQLGTIAGTALAGDTDLLQLTDLSVSTATASGAGSLAYNDTTGVFTFTPAAAADTGIQLTDLSVSTATASGAGSLTYSNTTGVFTFTPAAASATGIELTDLSVSTATASGGGSLTYNNTTGVFTFTPADLSSYLTSETFTTLVQDTTPQLGGTLDLNGNALEDTNCTFSMNDDTTVANRPTITLNSELDIYNVLNNQATATAGNTANFFIHDGAVTPSFTNWKLKFTHEGVLETVGDIRSQTNIIAYYTSDQTLKTDITPIQNSLDKVDTLRGVDFNWIDSVIESKGGEDGYFVRKKDVGVIAQEVQTVIPEAVATRKDGTLGVRYEALIPLLIEAIKELKARVEELENGNITKN